MTLPFVLEAKGSHSGEPTGRKKTGIHSAFAFEVDTAAMGKEGPQAILNGMLMNYKGQQHLLCHLPTRAMIKNRRGYLTRQATKATSIDTFADLYHWASLRMCQDKTRFFNGQTFDRTIDEKIFATETLGFQNELLVLNCFEHRYVEEGKDHKSFGVIMTTRRVFRNDLYRDSKVTECSPLPMAHTSYTTTWMLSSAVWITQSTLQTRSPNVSSGITVLDCPAHVARKCREKTSLLTYSEYFKNNVEINIRQMHHARSSEEFKAMAKLCTGKWRDDKQNAYADWFSKVYLSDSRRATYPAFYPRKMRWSRITELSRRAVSGSSEPRPECPKGPFGHYCEGPLPSQMILRTLGHGATGVHWIKRDPGKQTGILRSVFFNTSTYMSLGEEVTQERVTRYCEAKDGRFLETDTIQDINLHFLSLHQVEFIGDPDQLLRFQFALQPVITMDKIKEI
ncbi:hypothetical protein F441_02166 [Phytophthora nicotianae CJ01A1]|uniref:Uncharacterized protein n=1 Tax=Phytophthora nicotianae CJ01A1 TaxID=1317063 RepID=W2XQD5_PHYNI|nr:hypothetical protein F441_02166 [Phytophthora nicotianae CJ01A1]